MSLRPLADHDDDWLLNSTGRNDFTQTQTTPSRWVVSCLDLCGSQSRGCSSWPETEGVGRTCPTAAVLPSRARVGTHQSLTSVEIHRPYTSKRRRRWSQSDLGKLGLHYCLSFWRVRRETRLTGDGEERD